MSELQKIAYQGKLKIGEKEISCAILEDGTRVMAENSVFKAFDRPSRGNSRVEGMPVFLDSKSLVPYAEKDNRKKYLLKVSYLAKNGKVQTGFKAEMLPIICDIYLEARRDGILTTQQQKFAVISEILLSSLSKLGIVALIDEATGYQIDRDKDELQKLLSKYISEELLPWQKRFPDEYYIQLFRLHNWSGSPLSKDKPQVIGTITNRIVYDLLPKGVLEKLRELNPLTEKGFRQHKHHQFLTPEIGNEQLKTHLIQIIGYMKISRSMVELREILQRAYPDHNGFQKESLF